MKLQTQIIIMILILSVASDLAQGQRAEKARTDEAPEAARLDTLRARGFEAMYNLDYQRARLYFKEIVQLFPEHPAGPQFLATSIWLELLNRSQRLQSALYSTDSIYVKNEDRVDPRTLAQFREWTGQAKLLAAARLRSNPRDAETLYFLGLTEGLKAAFSSSVEHRFMASLRDGSHSVERHRAVLKLDADFHDAELTIGMYDYILGALPLPVKMLASIGGMRGSKRRGIETLERVAREGRWARANAKVMLIAIYKREKRYTEALATARELAEKYPRNYMFKLETADALISQAAIERRTKGTAEAASRELEAFGIFEALLQDRMKLRDQTAPSALDLIYFRYGEARLISGQPERAAKEFLNAAGVAHAEPGLATMARLRAAQALDLAGKRNEALVEYRAVLSRANVYNAHTEARRGLRETFQK